MTLSLQMMTMLHMVGAGIYLGLAMDTYDRLRQQPKWQASLIIQDIWFWLTQVAVIFLWLKAVNEGEVRVTIFLAMLLGFATYKALLESFYRRFLETVIRGFIRMVRFGHACWQFFIWRPLIIIYQVLLTIIIFVGGLLWKILLFLWRFLMILGTPFSKSIQRLWQKWNKSSATSDPKQDENEQIESNRKEGFWMWMAKWFKRRLR